MTVPSTARRAGPYTGNGSTTTFSFTFKTFAAGDLVVTRTASTGVETTLVLNSDYSVSLNVDQDASPGGTITYPITGSPLPAGYKLTIVGDLAYEQTTDLLGGGAFNARVIEDTFDRTVIQIQQLEERLDRALVAPVSDTPVDMTMPAAANRANRYLSFDATGKPISTTFDIDAVQNASTAAVSAAAAAAVSEANAAASEATALAQATFVSNTVAATTPTVVNFSGDGATVAFTLPSAPGAEENTLVFIGGVYQQKTEYSVAGTTLTFTSAPPAGINNIEVQIGPATNIAVNTSLGVSYLPSGIGAIATTVQTRLRETDAQLVYASVAGLISSTATALGVGAVWGADGFRYTEAAASATDHHLTTAGGVKLYVQPDTQGYDVRAFGADPTGATDSAAAIQKAIDAASANKVGNVWVRGVFLCNDRLVLKRGANLRGNWHQSASAATFISRIAFVNTSVTNKRACLVLDRAEASGIEFVEFTGIEFSVSSANGGWESIVYNKEVHWHRIRACYFSGSVTGAVIWWGAVLYPLIEDCIFSIQGATVVVDGRETNYDITYYGVNWGLIQNNSIFGGQDVFWGNGLITIRGNNIENGSPSAALCVVRVYGPSAIGLTIENNYLEWGNSFAHCFVRCESGGQGSVLSRGNYAPLKGQSIAFDCDTRALGIDTDGDYFGAVGQMIRLPSSGAQVNMGRNGAFGTASLKPGQWWNGTPGWRAVSVTQADNGRRYLRTEEEIVRSQFIERTIWQNATLTTAGPHTIFLGRGDNISIQYTSGVLLADRLLDHLTDAGLYPGARVVIYNNGETFTIRHNRSGGVHAAWTTAGGSGYTTASVSFSGGGGSGAAATATIRDGAIQYIQITSAGSGYTSAPTMTITGDGTGAVGACCRQAPFIFTKGADTALPPGRAIEFVVAPDRNLREVGDYSVRL